MPRVLSLLLFLLASGPFAVATAPLTEQHIRVLLFETSSEITIVAPGPHTGSTAEHEFQAGLGLRWPVRLGANELLVDGRAIGRSLTLVPAGGAWLEIDGLPYRGGVTVQVGEAETMLVINTVFVDDYLRGVLPAEMPPGWPAEALKAQAVASRTYALASLEPAEPYDICATTDCQVYGGVLVEDDRTNAAITATTGEVVMFGQELAQTYYHSDSGGHVASSSEVWGAQLPYLSARSDVQAVSPHRSWTFRLDPARMQHDLQALGYAPGTVTGLRVVEYSDSGRAVQADIVTTAGTIRLAGSLLSSTLRGWGMKSTRFRMTGDLSATGDGWGHGVGMSQYGARSLASTGSHYAAILEFYYPQTVLSTAVEAEPKRYIQW